MKHCANLTKSLKYMLQHFRSQCKKKIRPDFMLLCLCVLKNLSSILSFRPACDGYFFGWLCFYVDASFAVSADLLYIHVFFFLEGVDNFGNNIMHDHFFRTSYFAFSFIHMADPGENQQPEQG